MSHKDNLFSASTNQTLRLVVAMILLLLSLNAVKAQQTTTSVTDGSTPSGLQPGSPAGSYALSGFDNVNLYNGNLNFHMPLLQINGRGSAQMEITLALNVKSWHVSHFHKELPDGNTIDSYKPTQLGWRPYSGYGLGLLTGRNYGLQTSTNLSCTWYGKTLSRITFSKPDGTEYELRDQLTNGQPLNSSCTQGANRGKVFVTADGIAATFISDTDVIDNPAINVFGPHGFSVSGYLMLRDGTRYRIDGGNVTWMRDRNGNTLRFAYTSSSMTITDSLNRTVTVNLNVSDVVPYGLCDQIVYNGFAGVQRIIRVSHTNLANVLRPNSGYSIKTLGGTNGLFPELTGGSPSTTYDPTDMTSAVWMPDGRSYKFFYNSYGELARVELPTGGAVEYDMTPDSGVRCNGACVYPEDRREIYRRVVERRDYPSGSTGSAYELKDVYVNSEAVGTNSSTVTVEQSPPDGTILERSRHYFDGSALNSLFTEGNSGYGPWYEGHERQTELLNTSGALSTATVLRRIVNTWAQQSHISWWTGYGPQSEEAPNNPRLIETVMTIEPSGANLATKQTAIDPSDPTGQTIGFDQFNNPTDVWRYGFDGSFLGRVHTEYVTTGNYINANADPLLGAHLRSLQSRRWVSSDVAGANKVSLTNYEYDNYATDARHKPLTARSGITGLCLRFDSAGTCDRPSDASFVYRGNLTGVTSYANASAITGPVTTSRQYDVAGNIVADIDGRVNQTALGYQDSFCNGTTCGGTFTANTYAFASTRTSATPDPTGQHGSATAFVTTGVYDFSTGSVTSVTDPNNQVMSYQYTDVLDRLTAIIRPTGGGRCDFEYGDTVGNLFLRTLSDLDTSRRTDTYEYFDGLGRPIETRLYENVSQYIATKQIPFVTQQDPDTGAFMRATQRSNPYRPLQGEQPIWTTTFLDALGQVSKVRTPDNSIIRTTYSGNAVTVTDQSGRQRRTLTDALGRLVRADEPDKDTGSLGTLSTPVQPTYYEYDAMGNLRHVIAGSQERWFNYNSLSRLTSASSPESGTITYQYDDNGNLTQKTDARSITVTYEYDALDRNFSVNYSNTTIGNPDVPDVLRFYDGATNGKGRLWYSYAGGNETLGNNVDKTTIDTYNALGKPKLLSQRFKLNGSWSASVYQVSRDYNLGGAVTSQVYPSQHLVTYNYDSVGRLGDNAQNFAFTGTLGDGALRTYSKGILYSPAGQLKQEQFGTNTPVYNKLFYNSRQQLAQILANTTGDDTSSNRGKILNQYSLQCSGIGCNATDNNGKLRKQEMYIPNNDQGTTSTSWYQQYDYDQLNRLKRVHEYTGNANLDWQQEFVYDRWGNRTINGVGTFSGPATPNTIPEPNYGVDPANNNRLTAPTGYSLTYDAVGNVITDTYVGGGTRTYDADNRMIQAGGGTSQYTYNAEGQRVRRKIDGVETWQIYGFDGELLAEYAANSAKETPAKEYGYRNGQLLITAEPGSASAPPAFADDFNDNSLNANSWTVYGPGSTPTVSEQSQQLQMTLSPNTAAYNGVYSNSTYDLTNRMVQVESVQAVSQAGWCENFLEVELNANNYFMIQVGAGNMIFRSRVNGVNDSTSIPFDAVANRFWRIRHDQSANLIYFETSANDSVWLTRKTVTPGFSLTSLRFDLLAGAYGTGNSSPGAAKYDNFKLLASSAGSVSLTVPNAGFETPVLGNGNFQYSPSGGSWSFANGGGISGMNSPFTGVPSAAPDGVQIAFIQATGTISESISGFQASANYVITFSAIQRTNCCNTTGQDIGVYIDSTLVGTFHPGNTAYVEYSTAPFTTTTGAHTIKFAGLNGAPTGETAFIDKVRISGNPKPGFGVQWLLADQLGTPRMIFDETGNNVRRHDYLPYGEPLRSGTGLRATGYLDPDGVRQQFTQYERDNETGLDFANARYYSSNQGRFARPDPYNIIFEMKTGRNAQERAALLNSYISAPQNWDRYTYSLNDPINLFDPSGLVWLTKDEQNYIWVDDKEYEQNRDEYKDYTVANGAITTYQGSSNCPQCSGLIKGDLVQLREDGEIIRLDPNNTLQVLIPRVDDSYVSYSAGVTYFQFGGIQDSQSQLFATFGIGKSWATYSASRMTGTGPVREGAYFQWGGGNGIAANQSVNIFHPVRDGIQSETGWSTPNYGAGIQFTIGPLKGTTDYDRAHSPDNPNGRPFYTGRCPY